MIILDTIYYANHSNNKVEELKNEVLWYWQYKPLKNICKESYISMEDIYTTFKGAEEALNRVENSEKLTNNSEKKFLVVAGYDYGHEYHLGIFSSYYRAQKFVESNQDKLEGLDYIRILTFIENVGNAEV